MIPEHERLEAYLRDLQKLRPFEGYQDQPDAAERKRRDMQAIPFALPAKRDEWTPCWSAHAYGFDDSWWRANSMDGEDCRCSAEKIARIQEQGSAILFRRATNG